MGALEHALHDRWPVQKSGRDHHSDSKCVLASLA